MRERINRLAKGIIDGEAPILLIKPLEFQDSVRVGEIARKELYVASDNSIHIKGLAYSSNPRVGIGNGAFGGLRNHISFEVNSTYLDYGDVIEGVFSLITNAGEREIPYSFRVESVDSGRVLENLKEPEDFLAVAEQDYDLALRLFEYQDFAQSVDFMQDMHIRAIYDGIKGHGQRQAQLEQFLVALGVKKPVRMIVSNDPKSYVDPDDIVKDTITVHREGWGYLPITVSASGDFIQLSKNSLGDGDFDGDICECLFQISPSRLHGGKNYGVITFRTMTETQTVQIHVRNGRNVSGSERRAVGERYRRYLKLRLDYESGVYEPALLLNQMQEELEQIKMVSGADQLQQLLTAEVCVLSGCPERAILLLDEIRPAVLEGRQERPDLYCILQYITIKAQAGGADASSFIRLLHKYIDEGVGNYLQFSMLVQLDESLTENPGDMLAQMRSLYIKGCHSPFLYVQALKLWEGTPQLLGGLGAFEIQVLYLGAREKIVGEELALRAAKLMGAVRHYNYLCCKLLSMLYEDYQRPELLEAVCAMMIRGDLRRQSDFIWYERAQKEGLSLTRLYEYYLYTLPESYSQLIPRELLLYFSYDHELDRHSNSVLYKNILTYMKEEDPLYKDYERKIGAFATEQIFAARINSRLAVIYDRMIYKDMIDLPAAKVLPGILKSYRISCKNQDMKYVVICYEELTEEGIYPLEGGIAYAPMFSTHSQIMFQDGYGNRYTKIRYVKTPVMDQPELEARCLEVYPDHPMLLLKACREAAGKESLCQEDILLLERALTELKLHPLYKKNLTARIIGYYQELIGQDGDLTSLDSGYLLTVDQTMLTKEQRAGICEALIGQNYVREAYEMIRKFGYEGIGLKRLQKLCTKMILEKLFDQDELLLTLAYQIFLEDLSDSVILDYLCEFFNGTCEQMFRVLSQGVREHVETYDMEERLLAQMLFADNTGKMDKVFSLYMKKKKTGESIVKAYFTMKSAEYFLHGEPADHQVFAYLEGMINQTVEKDKLSTIYLLALTKYYAGLNNLEEDQRRLCQAMVDILLEEGMVFPYFKELAAHIILPEQVMDKAILQYCGRKDSKIDLQVRILPDEEEFHKDEMKRVYLGIFIYKKILFEGEILEYQIREWNGSVWELKQEGATACDSLASGNSKSRFACLNEMALCLSLKEEAGLKNKMRDYLIKTAAVEELFGQL